MCAGEQCLCGQRIFDTLQSEEFRRLQTPMWTLGRRGVRVRTLLAVVSFVLHLIVRVKVRTVAAAVALSRLEFAQRVVLAIRIVDERVGVRIVLLRTGTAGRGDTALRTSAMTNDWVVAKTTTTETKALKSRCERGFDVVRNGGRREMIGYIMKRSGNRRRYGGRGYSGSKEDAKP